MIGDRPVVSTHRLQLEPDSTIDDAVAQVGHRQARNRRSRPGQRHRIANVTLWPSACSISGVWRWPNTP